eukprot:4220202-Ditylum_brightwellii.AAC.1
MMSLPYLPLATILVKKMHGGGERHCLEVWAILEEEWEESDEEEEKEEYMPFIVEVQHKHASPPFPPSLHASHKSTVIGRSIHQLCEKSVALITYDSICADLAPLMQMKMRKQIRQKLQTKWLGLI